MLGSSSLIRNIGQADWGIFIQHIFFWQFTCCRATPAGIFIEHRLIHRLAIVLNQTKHFIIKDIDFFCRIHRFALQFHTGQIALDVFLQRRCLKRLTNHPLKPKLLQQRLVDIISGVNQQHLGHLTQRRVLLQLPTKGVVLLLVSVADEDQVGGITICQLQEGIRATLLPKLDLITDRRGNQSLYCLIFFKDQD